MNNLNVVNIHDNGKSQVWVGLDSSKFQIKNSGNMIAIEDKANVVSKLKVGGSSGFTINLVGDKIKFTSNSGGSPLEVSKMSLRTEPTTSDIVDEFDEARLPNPSELEDGTIMMVVGGHWVEYSFDDLYDMIIDKMSTEYSLLKG